MPEEPISKGARAVDTGYKVEEGNSAKCNLYDIYVPVDYYTNN